MINHRDKDPWMVSNHIGERLREARLHKSLSTREAAAAALCSPSSIGDGERNEHEPSLHTLVRLCKVYGVPVAWVLEEAMADD